MTRPGFKPVDNTWQAVYLSLFSKGGFLTSKKLSIVLFSLALFSFCKELKLMRIVILVVFIFVSGYSFAGIQDKNSQCLKELKNDSRFSSIVNHLELDGQSAGSMLNDKARPDERQKQAITEWIDARSQCVNLSPNPVAIDLHMAFLSIVADLYNGQMTFGEYNRKWRALFKEKTQGKPVN